MPRISLIIGCAAFALAACAPGFDGGVFPSDNSSSSALSSIGMQPSPCTDGEGSSVTFDEAPLSLSLPCGTSLAKHTEPGRLGSMGAYRFSTVNAVPVFFVELLFYDRPTLATYEAACTDGSVTCIGGPYHTVAEFDELKAAYEGISDWKTRHMFVFRDRNVLVHNQPCSVGDSCVLRTYIFFVDDVMVEIVIQMSSDMLGEEADALFGELVFL